MKMDWVGVKGEEEAMVLVVKGTKCNSIITITEQRPKRLQAVKFMMIDLKEQKQRVL
jgi:hypothetical protein